MQEHQQSAAPVDPSASPPAATATGTTATATATASYAPAARAADSAALCALCGALVRALALGDHSGALALARDLARCARRCAPRAALPPPPLLARAAAALALLPCRLSCPPALARAAADALAALAALVAKHRPAPPHAEPLDALLAPGIAGPLAAAAADLADAAAPHADEGLLLPSALGRAQALATAARAARSLAPLALPPAPPLAPAALCALVRGAEPWAPAAILAAWPPAEPASPADAALAAAAARVLRRGAPHAAAALAARAPLVVARARALGGDAGALDDVAPGVWGDAACAPHRPLAPRAAAELCAEPRRHARQRVAGRLLGLLAARTGDAGPALAALRSLAGAAAAPRDTGCAMRALAFGRGLAVAAAKAGAPRELLEAAGRLCVVPLALCGCEQAWRPAMEPLRALCAACPAVARHACAVALFALAAHAADPGEGADSARLPSEPRCALEVLAACLRFAPDAAGAPEALAAALRCVGANDASCSCAALRYVAAAAALGCAGPAGSDACEALLAALHERACVLDPRRGNDARAVDRELLQALRVALAACCAAAGPDACASLARRCAAAWARAAPEGDGRRKVQRVVAAALCAASPAALDALLRAALDACADADDGDGDRVWWLGVVGAAMCAPGARDAAHGACERVLAAWADAHGESRRRLRSAAAGALRRCLRALCETFPVGCGDGGRVLWSEPTRESVAQALALADRVVLAQCLPRLRSALAAAAPAAGGAEDVAADAELLAAVVDGAGAVLAHPCETPAAACDYDERTGLVPLGRTVVVCRPEWLSPSRPDLRSAVVDALRLVVAAVPAFASGAGPVAEAAARAVSAVAADTRAVRRAGRAAWAHRQLRSAWRLPKQLRAEWAGSRPWFLRVSKARKAHALRCEADIYASLAGARHDDALLALLSELLGAARAAPEPVASAVRESSRRLPAMSAAIAKAVVAAMASPETLGGAAAALSSARALVKRAARRCDVLEPLVAALCSAEPPPGEPRAAAALLSVVAQLATTVDPALLLQGPREALDVPGVEVPADVRARAEQTLEGRQREAQQGVARVVALLRSANQQAAHWRPALVSAALLAGLAPEATCDPQTLSWLAARCCSVEFAPARALLAVTFVRGVLRAPQPLALEALPSAALGTLVARAAAERGPEASEAEAPPSTLQRVAQALQGSLPAGLAAAVGDLAGLVGAAVGGSGGNGGGGGCGGSRVRSLSAAFDGAAMFAPSAWPSAPALRGAPPFSLVLAELVRALCDAGALSAAQVADAARGLREASGDPGEDCVCAELLAGAAASEQGCDAALPALVARACVSLPAAALWWHAAVRFAVRRSPARRNAQPAVALLTAAACEAQGVRVARCADVLCRALSECEGLALPPLPSLCAALSPESGSAAVRAACVEALGMLRARGDPGALAPLQALLEAGGEAAADGVRRLVARGVGAEALAPPLLRPALAGVARLHVSAEHDAQVAARSAMAALAGICGRWAPEDVAEAADPAGLPWQGRVACALALSASAAHSPAAPEAHAAAVAARLAEAVGSEGPEVRDASVRALAVCLRAAPDDARAAGLVAAGPVRVACAVLAAACHGALGNAVAAAAVEALVRAGPRESAAARDALGAFWRARRRWWPVDDAEAFSEAQAEALQGDSATLSAPSYFA
eukprot:m51a1_g14148 hypothetical protein (1663) ;mRNA; r:17280-22268